jgi:hypothetical protein
MSPTLEFNTCAGTHMQINTTDVGPVGYNGMDKKYCFTKKSITSWQVDFFEFF